MAHFAELTHGSPTSGNPATVLRVIVVANEDILDEDGAESEAIGIAFVQSMLGGEWAQTSYNRSFGVRYAGKNMLYDGSAFYWPQPFPSWTLDANYEWQPPVPLPDDAALGRHWVWKEDSQTWVEEPQPPSWTWDENHSYVHPDTGETVVSPQYEPPKPYPDDGFIYNWNENTGNWNKVPGQ